MSLKDTDIKTPGDKSIAKKWKLPLSKVKQLVDRGADHEKEHNTNREKAKQVARDHIAERPDYYKMLKKAEKTDMNKLDEASKKQHKFKVGQDVEAELMKGVWSKGKVNKVHKNGEHLDFESGDWLGRKNIYTGLHHSIVRPKTVKEEELNELSNKLMKKYMKRAKGELNARDYVTRSGGDYQKNPDLFQHGPAWPGDHEVTDQYAKIHKRQRGMERATALMNIREVKTHGRISRPGWKPSKDSTTPASPGEPKGDAMKNAFDRIEKAFPKGSIKVGGRKEMKENTVNEIANTPKGQSTLVKYVRGAAKDLYNTGVVRGHDVASNPRPNGGDTELRKMTSRVSKNRQTGIERAVKRMNPGLKEEEMNIQELYGKGRLKDIKQARSKETYKAWKKAEKASDVEHDERGYHTGPSREDKAYGAAKHREEKADMVAQKLKHHRAKTGFKEETTMDINESHKALIAAGYKATSKRDAEHGFGRTYEHPKHGSAYMDADNFVHFNGGKGRKGGTYHGAKEVNSYLSSLKETTMDKQDLVSEAINNILEGNLENMRQNLYDVLQETAIEKLEERKKEIASNYFAQD